MIQRYDPTDNNSLDPDYAYMREAAHGEWVKHRDAAKLEAEVARLQSVVERLQRAPDEIEAYCREARLAERATLGNASYIEALMGVERFIRERNAEVQS